jgi:HSP90 family molecular chaperone
MIDNELEQVDRIMSLKYGRSMNAIGVSLIDDARKLSKLIKVDGLEPVDVCIQVGNIASLVSRIGGSQLYGDNVHVPLRELVQNASDAIRARRKLEDTDESYGDIIITAGNDETGEYIIVEDNGIGMSERVLTGPFLDFGQSFWGSDLMHFELPGLESKDFKSTGKYGIGFFSLFMWGNHVTVTTNKFGNSKNDTLVLEFTNGVYSRPILRKAQENECLSYGGTRVKIWFNKGIKEKLLNFKD